MIEIDLFYFWFEIRSDFKEKFFAAELRQVATTMHHVSSPCSPSLEIHFWNSTIFRF